MKLAFPDDEVVAGVVAPASRPEPRTLIELLRGRAERQPDRRAYSFLQDADGDETMATLTYGELDRRARAVAAWLRPLITVGERVLLLYPPGLDYIAAFFGCLYAGAVAVPAYPPRRNRNMLRLQSVIADAEASVALTTAAILPRVAPMFSRNPYLRPLRWLTSDEIDDGAAADWQPPAVTGEALAFLQYTSGSTSTPKGVMVSHANLLHNERVISAAFGQSEDSVIVGWLPLYHDMGLIGNVIQPLYAGAPCVLMSPVDFLQSPYRWLQAVSRFRATTSGGPNFAYDLCARKVTPEQRATLDLSSWTAAFSGAEPVRAETLRRFAEVFAPCGFRPEAFYPCYGLAEATLLVSGGSVSAPPVVRAFQGRWLENHCAVEAEEGGEARELVGCGNTLLDQRVVVAHPERLTECEPGEVGEVWVSGPSVAQGYWNRADETERTFRARLADTGEGPFLRTGDLGFVHGGELFVTGRLKDLVIIRGVNHYPQDIELTAERAHAALRPGCGAAFSVEGGGEERLVVVQEVERRARCDFDEVMQRICEDVAEAHEVQVHAVVLVKAGAIPKTTSGKIQRHAARVGFLERSLETVAEWRAADEPVGPTESSPAPAPASPEEVEGWLRAQLAARLRVAPASIDVNQPVSRYGLDSLAAVELRHLVETGLGVSIPLASLLDSTSVAQLAARVREGVAARPEGARPVAAPAPEQDAGAPLSPGQKALWFLHQLAPESAAYNIVSALRVESRLDAAALRRAFQALSDRHPMLRTTFAAEQGEPVQRTHGAGQIDFREVEASSWDEAELRERLDEEAQRPFDLARGPLLRVSLYSRPRREHVLLIVVHHIVADFWSLAVCFDELGTLYAAERSGAGATLPHLALRYADYVRWQEELLAGPEGEQHRAYWQRQLAGAPTALELPTDHTRPAVQTYRGASRSFRVDAGLTERLKDLGRARGATLYMTLLAAFDALLYRYTGQEDILVGSPTSGRKWAALSGVVGYFVNPVVIRARPSGGLSFESLLEDVRQTALEAFEHQDYPFPLLVEMLQPERDPSRSPLFQVMFTLQKSHLLDEEGLSTFALGEAGAAMRLGELELSSFALEQRVAQFDLSLMMSETEDGLAGSLQYNTDLFDAPTVERMLAHFSALLGGVAADPSLALTDLPLLSEAERLQLLRDFNDTRRDFPTDFCVHELFERQAARTPEAVALASGGGELSYGELNEQANQLARHLRALGVGAESRVGVLLERSPNLVVALLAVLKAGGAYVPLDPAYPRERLAFMLEDSGAGVLLTQRSLLDARPDFAGEILLLDDPRPPEDEARAESYEPSAVTPENLAYVIYTSGSTGRPKGVAIAHRSAAVLLHWAREVFTAEELSGVLASTSVCFDLSVFELFAPLSWGGKVILVRDALALGELGEDEAGTVRLVNTVPSAASELVRRGWLPSGVRAVCLAGEALTRALAERVHQSLEGRGRLLNLYGPTEDTTYSTWCEVGGGGGAVSIGAPIANTRAYVLDAAMGLAPAGVCGELYLGGEGLARGYLNRPSLTAERFVPDPHSGEPGARLYRTGDVVRWGADGELEYLGRADHQVKVRGFRIELGEIEAALSSHTSVRECAVVVREEAGGDKRLVAYLTGERERLGAGELRAHLKDRLPDYMTPSAFVTVDEFPLTPNGKVDRRALAAIETPAAEGGEEFVAPRNQVEELMAGMWADLLRLERVGVNDNFFDLGGHSLLATQLISRVREVLQVELPLRSVFEAPVISRLAEIYEKARQLEQGLHTSPIARAPRGDELPLSFAQQRLWYLDQLEPDSAFYNIPVVVRLKGRLDVEVLERALNESVRRHEVLRTVFTEVGGRPRQVIRESCAVHIPVRDLSGHTPESRESEVSRLAADEARRPFGLSEGPLLRAALLRLGDDEHVILLTMHHIVSDGWSMGVLIKEVAALYGAYTEGRESPLAELPVQYADYAAWQREHLQGETLGRQLAYWREQLGGGLTPLELPTDRPRPAYQTYRGGQQTFDVPAAVVESLKELSRAEGATLYMTLLAAFKTLLSRYSGREDIVVGTPVAGRTRAEVEDLVGLFVNMLVLRTELPGGLSFREALKRVREVALGAYAHQDVPFEKLVEELQPERDPSRSPLFQVMFVLQNAPLEALELPGLTLAREPVDSRTAKYDLSLSLEESAHGLHGSLEYNADLFDEATAARMLEHFRTLLEGVARDPSRTLSELPLLAPEERRLILRDWNDTRRDYPAGVCLHELFERQVERTPDAVALAYEGGRLTYAELNGRANRLARRLRSSGVGAESLVGVCVERSAELVVSLFAVLKAGGAYVPLDPSYPRERLAFMLEDSGAKVLLTQRRLLDSLPAFSGEVFLLDDSEAALAAERDGDLPRLTDEENLAYMIYTSGSTGRPKGAMNTHRAICNRLLWMQEAYGLGADDAVLQKTPFSFDVSVWEFFWPLLVGARLVMARPGGHKDCSYLSEVINAEGVTTIHFVPSMLHAFVEEGGPRECPGLRRVICSGEALPFELQERFHAQSAAELHNLYGPTEAAVDVTFWACRRDGASKTVPIGRPISNIQIYIVDAHMQPAPVGVAGELLIGGVGLARGYLGRPGLTAERFVPDPFSVAAGQRLYRTGDLARFLPGGEIEYLGRLDHQVKLRGFRIELGEIEATLSSHPRVGASVVVLHDGARGDKRLVAYVVGRKEGEGRGEALDAGELRRYVRERLPEYMTPAQVVPLEEMPLTPSGKVNRRALPEPGEAGREVSERSSEPRSAVEELMAGLWREVLGVERVGVEDNFFELGGHSLLATQLVSRVRETFKVKLSLRSVTEHPTVAGMARCVEREMQEGVATELPPLVRVVRGGELPLSFAQQRLWFFDRLAPDSSLYHISAAVRLRGALDTQALARAFSELSRRHEVLRTAFLDTGSGSPAVRVLDSVAPELPLTDLSGLPEPSGLAEALRHAADEARKPFDLSSPPLLRLRLFRLSGDEHLLSLVMHHIISDGWSVGVLVREVAALYEAFSEGKESPLPELEIQYADFAAWQRQYLQGEALERQLDYWRRQLAGAPRPFTLPQAKERPSSPSFRGGRVKAQVEPEVAAALRALSARNGATLYMTLLASFAALVWRWTGETDLVVGSAAAGRERREVEGLIGLFVNMLALRVDASGDPTFGELLGRVREVTLGGLAHQSAPFEKVVEAVRPERDGGGVVPLARVAFGLAEGAAGAGLGVSLGGGLEAEVVEAGGESSRFDLTVWVRESAGGGLEASWTYDRDLFEESAVRAMAGQFAALLASAAASGEAARLSALEFLSEEEKEKRVSKKRLREESNVRKLRDIRRKSVGELLEG